MTRKALKSTAMAVSAIALALALPAFAERTVTVESIDPATREIALAFGGTAEAERP